MAAYWLTFRLEDDATRNRRYDALTLAVHEMCTNLWVEPTSFMLFESSLTIDQVASAVGKTIDRDHDLVLIGMPDFKSARVLGRVDDDDLFTLMPFTKKA